MLMCDGGAIVVLFGQLSEVAVDVVGVAALGFKLDGRMFDAELRGDAVLNQLEQLRCRVMLFDHHVTGEHEEVTGSDTVSRPRFIFLKWRVSLLPYFHVWDVRDSSALRRRNIERVFISSLKERSR